ncbi:hydrocephalus-inducing protein homolog [Leptosomus discolor]
MGSSRTANGFQSKVVAPCNPKLVREAEEPVTRRALLEVSAAFHFGDGNLAKPLPKELLSLSVLNVVQKPDQLRTQFSAVDPEQSSFQPFPSEVVFQSYVPHEVYEVPLVLRNKDKVSRLLKVVLESSPYFKLIGANNVCRKVAPGMLSTFRIVFIPDENKDYFHQLICITEREKFIVPIRAIGARAILDFPDELNFSVCPVKHSTQKTLLVRNIGNREARYCLNTQSLSLDGPISSEVHPLRGALFTQE